MDQLQVRHLAAGLSVDIPDSVALLFEATGTGRLRGDMEHVRKGGGTGSDNLSHRLR